MTFKKTGRGWTVLLLSVLLLMVSVTARTQTGGASGENTAVSLRQIASELRQVHLELLGDRRELLQARMQDLDRELQVIQNQQRRFREELADVETQLSQPRLSKEDREDLETRRSDLTSPTGAASGRGALAHREAQVRERAAVLQQRIQLIVLREQQLAAAR